MVAFLQSVLGLTTSQQEADFAAFPLPEGGTFEVFGPADQDHEHFSTGPVVGFVVDDLTGAVRELEAVGVELLGGQVDERRGGWRHFRAEPVRRPGPFQPSPGCLYGLIRHMGLADGLTCGRVPPPHLGVLAAAGKIRRIRGMNGGTTPQDAHNPGPVPFRPGAGHPGPGRSPRPGRHRPGTARRPPSQ
jgi:hypothetical protein